MVVWTFFSIVFPWDWNENWLFRVLWPLLSFPTHGKVMTNLDSILKNKDITLLTKVYIVKAKVFPVVMYRCESQSIKTGSQRTEAFKLWCWRRLLSPLDHKEIKPVNPKGNKSWIFTGRTDAEAEAPILWTADVKSQLIRKEPDAGKDWKQKEKRVAEDEMVDSITDSINMNLSKDSEGQGSLACCSPWGQKKSDMT